MIADGALVNVGGRLVLGPKAEKRFGRRNFIAGRRDAFEGVLTPGRGGIEVEDGEIRWWTFAGGRINATLRHALEAVGGDWKVVPDNFMVRVRGEHLDRAAFLAALERLNDPAFWEDARLWAEVAGALPNYRLSKFQPLMPEWVEREVLGRFLLDVAGTRRWVAAGDSAEPPLG